MAKTCIECWRWVFDGGERGYSELTPGSDGFVGCSLGHWQRTKRSYYEDHYWSFYELDRDGFREFLNQAETCQDFADRALSAPDAGDVGQ